MVRVELSADGDASWIEARLLGSAQPWTWRLWEAEIEVARGRHSLAVRAVDSAANSQPAAIDQVWNFKGYMNNAWHRVDVVCE